jgi:hypothetical protein
VPGDGPRVFAESGQALDSQPLPHSLPKRSSLTSGLRHHPLASLKHQSDLLGSTSRVLLSREVRARDEKAASKPCREHDCGQSTRRVRDAEMRQAGVGFRLQGLCRAGKLSSAGASHHIQALSHLFRGGPAVRECSVNDSITRCVFKKQRILRPRATTE